MRAVLPVVLITLVAIAVFIPAAPDYVFTDDELRRLEIDETDLIRVQICRGGTSKCSPLWLIWTPLLAGLCTFVVLMIMHGLYLKTVVLFAALETSAALVIAYAAASTCPILLLLGVLVAAVGPPVWYRQLSTGRDMKLLLHLCVVAALYVAAVTTSFTTNGMLDAYKDGVVTRERSPEKIEDAYRELKPRAPQNDEDAIAEWERLVDQVIADPASRLSRFLLNRWSAIAFVIVAVFYLLVVWVILLVLPPRRTGADASSHGSTIPGTGLDPLTIDTRDVEVAGTKRSNWWLIPVCLVFYVAVGVTFAVLYFNIYLSAAAKQNVMTVLANRDERDSGTYEEYVETIRAFGPTESLIRKALAAGENRPGANGTIRIAEAAKARYWSFAVVALELPRLDLPQHLSVAVPADSLENLSPEVQQVTPDAANGEQRPVTPRSSGVVLALDPVVTYDDMLYFSFASLTTTNYGDIRPVSQAMRLWVVIENIIEVLFTAMFFVAAMEAR